MSRRKERQRRSVDWDEYARSRARAGLGMGPGSIVVGIVIAQILGVCLGDRRIANFAGVLPVLIGHMFSLMELAVLVARFRRVRKRPISMWLLFGYWAVLLVVMNFLAWRGVGA